MPATIELMNARSDRNVSDPNEPNEVMLKAFADSLARTAMRLSERTEIPIEEVTVELSAEIPVFDPLNVIIHPPAGKWGRTPNNFKGPTLNILRPGFHKLNIKLFIKSNENDQRIKWLVDLLTENDPACDSMWDRVKMEKPQIIRV
ncbi:MAG: hypothetical protein LKJ83_06780 [Eubacteriaceae bacterium]|jgi:hypothetical protein|nr:hypothetical protein [Eubacteriaceae bacterium]